MRSRCSLVVLMLVISLYSAGCINNTMQAKEGLFGVQEIEEFIVEANKIRDQIDYRISGSVIGYYDKTPVVQVEGSYSTLDDVMRLFGSKFLPEAVEVEIYKLDLCNVGGKIGSIEAAGEEFFDICDKSTFKITVDAQEYKEVEVSVFSEEDNSFTVIYTLQKISDGEWKIAAEEGFGYDKDSIEAIN